MRHEQRDFRWKIASRLAGGALGVSLALGLCGGTALGHGNAAGVALRPARALDARHLLSPARLAATPPQTPSGACYSGCACGGITYYLRNGLWYAYDGARWYCYYNGCWQVWLG